MAKAKNPLGPPMTLGNMRHLGVHHLVATSFHGIVQFGCTSMCRPREDRYYVRRRYGPLSRHRFDPLRCGFSGRESDVKRRSFIAVLGSVVVWPVVARAQQHEHPIRIIGL
jgi:hypothetical protein